MSRKNTEEEDKKNISFNDFGDLSEKNDNQNEQDEEQNQSQLEVVSMKEELPYISGNQDENNDEDLMQQQQQDEEDERNSQRQIKDLKHKININQQQQQQEEQLQLPTNLFQKNFQKLNNNQQQPAQKQFNFPKFTLPQKQQDQQQQQQKQNQQISQQQQYIQQQQQIQQQQLLLQQQQKMYQNNNDNDNDNNNNQDDYQEENDQNYDIVSPNQQEDQQLDELEIYEQQQMQELINLKKQQQQQQKQQLQQQQQQLQDQQQEQDQQIDYQTPQIQQQQYINSDNLISQLKCMYHQDEQLCYYCKSCKDFRICVQCLSSGAHEGHEIINNKKASSYFTQNIKDITVILKERCEFLSLRESVIVNHGKEIQDYFRETLNFIRKKFSEVTEYLEKKEEEYKDNLQDVQSKTLFQFEKDLTTLHQEYEKSLEKLNFYKSAVDQDNPALITRIYSEKIEEIEQLLHSSIQSYFTSPQVASFTSISLKKEDLQLDLKNMIENIKKFIKKVVFEESPEKQIIVNPSFNQSQQQLQLQQLQFQQQQQQQITDANVYNNQQINAKNLNSSQNIQKSQIIERQQYNVNPQMSSMNSSAYKKSKIIQSNNNNNFNQSNNNNYSPPQWYYNNDQIRNSTQYNNNSRINQVKQEIDLCLGQKTKSNYYNQYQYNNQNKGLIYSSSSYIGKKSVEAKIRSLSPSSNNSSMNQSKNNSYNASYTANKYQQQQLQYTQNSQEKSYNRRVTSNVQSESSINKSLSILKMQNVLFQRGMQNFYDNN